MKKTGKETPKTAFKTEDVLVKWLRFNRDRQWSRRQKLALLQHFKDINAAIKVSANEAMLIFNEFGISSRRRHSVVKVDDSKVAQELAWLAQAGHYFLNYDDERYPALLRQIDDPPLALFASGDIGLLDNPKVAIVGSRRPSPFGVKVTSDIAGSFSKLDVVVVSGLALGIDAAAHKAALDADGPTIAVLGSGIDIVYPQRHAALFERIESNGLILSEYPCGLPPSRYTFPDRNRLVSGLSSGVVIVEAADRSGTLITARLAMEQNREVMVVPGPALSAHYVGSHGLIQDGAALVCNGNDVLAQLENELSLYCMKEDHHSHMPTKNLTPEQAVIMASLAFEPVSIDTIVEDSGLATAEVSRLLLELELDGMVATSLEGGYIRMA